MADELKIVIGIAIGGLLFILSFYPLRSFIPEGFWPFVPNILLEFPIMYILNQIAPGIMWLGFFVIGVLIFKWAIE